MLLKTLGTCPHQRVLFYWVVNCRDYRALALYAWLIWPLFYVCEYQWYIILLVFPYLGLTEIGPTYKVELGCVVGVTDRRGLNYSADTSVSKIEDEEVTVMVQVTTTCAVLKLLGGQEQAIP